jgi:hypothetical protein
MRLGQTLAVVAVGLLGTASLLTLQVGKAMPAQVVSDPPRIVPWSKVGDIGIGMLEARVTHEYGNGYPIAAYPYYKHSFHVNGYRLHGRRVEVAYYKGRVAGISVYSPYYQTPSGFGVGSRIPLGACHRTKNGGCKYTWNGFTYVKGGGFWFHRQASGQKVLIYISVVQTGTVASIDMHILIRE